jgi:hypothetical protein
MPQLDSAQWMTLLVVLRRLEERLERVESSMRELTVNGISVALRLDRESEGESGSETDIEPTSAGD